MQARAARIQSFRGIEREKFRPRIHARRPRADGAVDGLEMWAVQPGSALDQASDDEQPPAFKVDLGESDDAESLPNSDLENGVEDLADGADGANGVVAEEADDDDEGDGDVLDGSITANALPERALRKAPTARYFDPDPSVDPAGLRRRSNVCFNCGSAAHNSYACPEEVCIICLGRGHRSHECSSGGRPNVCSACGRVGHMREACPHRAFSPPADVSSCRCAFCGELGHVNCAPEEVPRPRNTSCFNCGKEGHEAPWCPYDGMDRWQGLFASGLRGGINLRGGKGSKGGGKGRGGGSGRGGRGGKGGGAGRSFAASSLSDLMRPSGGGGRGQHRRVSVQAPLASSIAKKRKLQERQLDSGEFHRIRKGIKMQLKGRHKRFD